MLGTYVIVPWDALATGRDDIREKCDLQIQATCIDLAEGGFGKTLAVADRIHYVSISVSCVWHDKGFTDFKTALDGGKPLAD